MCKITRDGKGDKHNATKVVQQLYRMTKPEKYLLQIKEYCWKKHRMQITLNEDKNHLHTLFLLFKHVLKAPAGGFTFPFTSD